MTFNKLLLLISLMMLTVGFVYQQNSGSHAPAEENVTTIVTTLISTSTTTTTQITDITETAADVKKTEILVKNISKIENQNDKTYISNSLTTEHFAPVVVELNDSSKIDDILSDFNEDEFRLQRVSLYSPLFSGNTTKSGLTKLENSPYVIRIYSGGYTVTTSLAQSIPLINGNDVLSLMSDIYNVTGKGQTVCVIDTGVNYTHPDLGGCFGSSCKVVSGYNFIDNNNDINDTDVNGHGTSVAGIVSANGATVGVAPNVSVVALKAVGEGSTTDIIVDAISWCINNRNIYNISVISMSFSIDDPLGNPRIYNDNCDSADIVVKAANNATVFGLLAVAASGNSGNTTGISSPACGSNVTSVGATYDLSGGAVVWNNCTDMTTKIDQITCSSNRASILDLFAPGALINSTARNGRYAEVKGTSFSTPHVAGLAALMKQANNSLLPADLQTIMNYTGKPIYDPATQLTFRRIDALRSVLAVMYNLFISDFEIIDSNAGNRLFQFKIFNDLYTPAGVAWNISYGDGKSDVNTGNLTLDGHQETIVFASHDYSRPGNYTITVYTNSTTDNSNAMSRTIEVRPIEVNSLKLLNSSSLKNVYGFNILSPESDLNVSWVLYPQDGTTINSTHNISLIANQTVFVYFENDYASAGVYNVTANVTDTDKRYFDLNAITATVV